MTRDDLLQLESLAALYSPEIHRDLTYFTTDELRGHLAYLRRIHAEATTKEAQK